MEKETLKPEAGVGVLIFKNGKILLGKRKDPYGKGEYSFPGGTLEYMESFKTCAKRETQEECGLKIKNIRFQLLANLDNYAPKHYVNIGVMADWESGEPQAKEPDQYDSWDWYNIDNLPEPLFEPVKLSIDSYKTGKNYYDLEDDYYKKAK